MLEQLIQYVTQPLNYGMLPELPEQLALFHCLRPQHLHNVPLHYPSAIFVLSGEKSLYVDGQTLTIPAGDVLLLPPGQVALSNTPPANGRYVALTLSFPDAPITPDDHATPQQSKWSLPTPDALWLLIHQWLEAHQQHPLPESWQLGRCREIRDQLLATGRAGHLRSRPTTTTHQVLDLFYSDLTYNWQLTEVADSLHCSTSTLQRQLARDGTGFRELLEQARMVTALGLLQGTQLPIHVVADRVGYLSSSRFSERFRRHFGLLPKVLKDTQSQTEKRHFEAIK